MGYSIACSSDKHAEIHATEAKNGRCIDVEVCCALCAVTCDPGLNQPVMPGVCDDVQNQPIVFGIALRLQLVNCLFRQVPPQVTNLNCC